MTSRIDRERVQALLTKLALNDREIGERIGVHQSTVWRLRKGDISKVSRFIIPLNNLLPAADRDTGSFSLDRLATLAQQSPALMQVLKSLSEFMHEDAKG